MCASTWKSVLPWAQPWQSLAWQYTCGRPLAPARGSAPDRTARPKQTTSIVIDNDEMTLPVCHKTKFTLLSIWLIQNISKRIGSDADLDPQTSMRIQIRQTKADPDPHHWYFRSAKFFVYSGQENIEWNCLSFSVFLCVAGRVYWRKGGGGGRSKSYEGEKA
jgi:hypothetical protein